MLTTNLVVANTSGLLSPREMRRAKTFIEDSVAANTSKSPSMSKVKRNKTTLEEFEAPSLKVKKLYGTKTSLDDLRQREGWRNELWEQAVDSDPMRGDTRKLKRKKPSPEVETRSFAEIISVMTPSQDSLVTRGTIDINMDQLESALESHNNERRDEPTPEELKQRESPTARGLETTDTILDATLQQNLSVQNLLVPIASSETILEDKSCENPPAKVDLGPSIAVSITKRDSNISQSPIIAPSISQLANQADQSPPKPSRKRKQPSISSQADELASEDIIGLPKEQYEPRPSRSRRQNDHVDELVKGIDYSKTVESIVRSSRKGKASKSKAKRRQTTGCFLGSTKGWDDDEEGDEERKDTEVIQILDNDDDVVAKSQRRSKTAGTETLLSKSRLNDDKEQEGLSSKSLSKETLAAPETSSQQDLAEFDEEDIKKPPRRRKPNPAQTTESQALQDIAESEEEDDLLADLPSKPRGRQKSTATQAKEPLTIDPNPEDTDKSDDFQPLEDLAEPPTSEPVSKKKRGRPKKQDAEPVAESSKQATSTQPTTDPPPKPSSKRRKTKETPSTLTDETPTIQPLTESPTKANATLHPPLTSANCNPPIQDEGLSKFTEKVPPPQLTTPQKDKGTSEQRAIGKEEAPSPSKKHHSPLSSSKVPLRVGLSRRQRIEPLLRIRR